MPSVFVLKYKRSGRSTQLLGLYSSRSAADDAVVRFRVKPELRNYLETFTVCEYELDKDAWDGEPPVAP